MEKVTTVVKMISTTNESFKYKIGKSGFGEFYKGVFWMDNFHTSYVSEVQINENIMTVKTRNSEYVFELIGEHKFLDFKLLEEDMQDFENNINSHLLP